MPDRRTLASSFLLAVAAIAACSSSDAGDAQGAGAGATSSTEGDGAGTTTTSHMHGSSSSTASGGEGGDGGAGGTGGTMTNPCEPPGHYGVATTKFTLPSTPDAIYYQDIQASFPAVDWTTLDRLYIPAGHYKHLFIGNLPVRDASRPLVITNKGGQVNVGPDIGGNYIWSMGGGANWILTGRYDPDSETGDVDYPGHACGAYATARGHYGFHSDDAFDFSGAYTHMGVAIGDATDFEVEYLEVERSGFAGIRFLNQATAQDDQPMSNVKLHDTYVHDTAGEGIYLGWTGGPPSNLMRNLQIYNNRFVRTGNEALQIQQLGEGSHVHHNVMLHGALHFRDNGLGAYQDNNAQILMREGSVVVEKNVFVGAAALLLNLFGSPETGDADIHLSFHDNFMADDIVGSATYFNGAVTPTSTYVFDHNWLRGLDFAYTEIDPGATDPDILFSFNGTMKASIAWSNNTWQDGEHVTYAVAGPNGASGQVTATGNAVAAVAPIAFRDTLYTSGKGLEFWTASTTRNPGDPARTYEPGEVVLHTDGVLYTCTKESTNQVPPDHPDAWSPLAAPVDDVRVVAGSPYEGVGVY